MNKEDIEDRLAKLPHRAIVAFAARCARRVQPLTHALSQRDRDVIERAIAVAEAFANSDTADTGDAEAAGSAAGVIRAAAGATAGSAAGDAWAAAEAATAAIRDVGAGSAAWAAARDTAWAAAGRAAGAIGDAGAATAWTAAWTAGAATAWAAAASDLDRLSALELDPSDTLGAPIDPSEAGPLGPLWPQGVPQWLL